MGTDGSDGDLGAVIRARLDAALRDRDVVASSALRSALAAIANAEAVPPNQAPRRRKEDTGGARIAGALAGLGAGEVERRVLSGADVRAIVRAEVAERRVAAAGYQQSGHRERAERLHREAEVLETALRAAMGGSAAGAGQPRLPGCLLCQ